MNRGKFCRGCNMAVAIGDPERVEMDDGSEAHARCVGKRLSVVPTHTRPQIVPAVNTTLHGRAALGKKASNGMSHV